MDTILVFQFGDQSVEKEYSTTRFMAYTKNGAIFHFKNQEYVLSSIDHFFNENGVHEKTVLSFDKK